MDQIVGFAGEYGITAAVLVWLLVGIGNLAGRVIPDLLQLYRDFRTEQQQVELDKLDHSQKIELNKEEIVKLREMWAQQSKSFMEDQLTQMTAESQVQLSAANEFIYREVNRKLDLILMMVQTLRRSGTTEPPRKTEVNFSAAETKEYHWPKDENGE